MSRLTDWTTRLQFAHYLLAVLGAVLIGLLSLGWRAAKADDRYVPRAEYEQHKQDESDQHTEVIRQLGILNGKVDLILEFHRNHNER